MKFANFIFQNCLEPSGFCDFMWNRALATVLCTFCRPHPPGFYVFSLKSSSRYSPLSTTFADWGPKRQKQRPLGDHGSHFTQETTRFRARESFQAWIHAFPNCYTSRHGDMMIWLTWRYLWLYIYIYVAEGITDNVDYTGVSENGTDQDYKIFGNIWAIPFWPRLRHPLPTTGGMSNIPPSSISICPFFQVLPVLQHQVTRSRHAENVQRRERYAMGGAKTVVCRQHLKNGVYCLESAVKNVVTIYIRQFWYVLVCSCKW